MLMILEKNGTFFYRLTLNNPLGLSSKSNFIVTSTGYLVISQVHHKGNVDSTSLAVLHFNTTLAYVLHKPLRHVCEHNRKVYSLDTAANPIEIQVLEFNGFKWKMGETIKLRERQSDGLPHNWNIVNKIKVSGEKLSKYLGFAINYGEIQITYSFHIHNLTDILHTMIIDSCAYIFNMRGQQQDAFSYCKASKTVVNNHIVITENEFAFSDFFCCVGNDTWMTFVANPRSYPYMMMRRPTGSFFKFIEFTESRIEHGMNDVLLVGDTIWLAEHNSLHLYNIN